MHGARAVAQGKKGTGDDKESVGFRCPMDLYTWLKLDDPDTNKSGVVTSRLRDMHDLEHEAGPRLRELKAQKELEGISLGALVARLALEALDSKPRGKK